MKDVLVTLYERETDRYGELEYFYRVAIVPGGTVINRVCVAGDIPQDEAMEKARKEIADYLEENGYHAVTKY